MDAVLARDGSRRGQIRKRPEWILTGHRRPPLPEGRASSELEQIASSLPGEVTKSGQRSTWRTAATALDNRRLRR
jgi:hypothetical protein